MQHDETPNAGVLCIIPFFHIFGLVIGLHVSVAKGYRMLLVPRFDPLDLMPLFSLIEAQRPMSIPAVPTLWAALLSHPKANAALFDSVLVASSGGAALPGWVQARYHALTGRRIYEAYGLSEAAGATHCTPYPQGGPEGSIGKPLPGLAARVVALAEGGDPDRDLPVGEVGELVLQGDAVMTGYFQQPERSALALREGWLHTGDLVYCDRDGFFYVVDRADDLIITSAHNVYPSEVEAVLSSHPAVAEVAVVGKPDRLRGSVVCAYVVRRGDASVSVDDLLALCRANLVDYKVPRQITFVDSIPHNPAGKILRRALRSEPSPAQ
jgi:long-chain acyl-CoA synthetase